MTAPFGRRNRVTPPSAQPAPKSELVLTPEQRAYLFGVDVTERAAERGSAVQRPVSRPVRRAGLIACAAMTAVAVGVGTIGGHDGALAGAPGALAPTSGNFLVLTGSGAGAFVLVWSMLVTFANFSANLWLTRKLAGTLGAAGFLAFAGLGALTGLAIAWLSGAFGLGDSEIGLPMEALAGAGLAGLYRLLSGAGEL
jgi:hypothetical protein